jgi:hypothetical protein
VNDDEALGLELQQCLSYRNPAHAQLGGDGFLPDLLATFILAADDSSAQLLGDRAGDGVTFDYWRLRPDFHDPPASVRHVHASSRPIFARRC